MKGPSQQKVQFWVRTRREEWVQRRLTLRLCGLGVQHVKLGKLAAAHAGLEGVAPVRVGLQDGCGRAGGKERSARIRLCARAVRRQHSRSKRAKQTARKGGEDVGLQGQRRGALPACPVCWLPVDLRCSWSILEIYIIDELTPPQREGVGEGDGVGDARHQAHGPNVAQ